MSVERNPSVKFIKIEKAKEYKDYQRMPKFDHKALAVIHPSPRKKLTPPREESPTFTIAAVPAKPQAKRHEPRVIPDHLLRAPMDSFTSSPTSGAKRGGGGRPATAGSKGKRGASAKGGVKKYESGESKRAKRAEVNKKTLFSEIKKLIDKAEEIAQATGGSYDVPVVPSQPGTALKDVKQAIADKRVFRFLCSKLTGNQNIQLLLLKQEFVTFIKILMTSGTTP
jgi:hypothetical protein